MQEAAKGQKGFSLYTFFHKANQVIMIISVIALMVMMLITVANITGRAIFDWPIVAAIEIAELSSVLFVACALAYTETTNSNIRVPLIIDQLKSKTARKAFDYFAITVAAIAVVVLIYAGFKFAASNMASGETTDILKLPSTFFRFTWVFGCICLFFAMVGNILKLSKKE